MSHLTLEALARVLDEPPGEDERTHLAACAVCRAELSALRGQTEALSALPSMIPAPDAWPELRERLREDRLLRESTVRGGAPLWRSGALRAAAAAFLFVAGGALGYTARGEVAAGPAVAGSPADAETGTGQALASSEAGVPGEAAGQELESPDLMQVEEAQEAFFSALDRYMAATGTEPSDPAARLAALDNIVLTTAEALNEAPADPVINSFYLTAVAQRNAMFRQMTTSADPVF